MPMDFLSENVVASDLLNIIPAAERFHFAVLMSHMHMAWMRTICGRLKSDYRYTPTIYNTFPWPELTDRAKATLTVTGQAILDARAAHPNATLADLYDPDSMPADLRKAHRENDRAVDRLYRRKFFESERERVEHLFTLYEKLRTPLIRNMKRVNRR